MRNSQSEAAAKIYWLSLSGLFAVLFTLYVIADVWWFIVGSIVLLASITVVTAKYGQLSKEARDHAKHYSPLLSWGLAALFAVGYLARASTVAPFLAPLIGIVGGATMYEIMRRKNMFYSAR